MSTVPVVLVQWYEVIRCWKDWSESQGDHPALKEEPLGVFPDLREVHQVGRKRGLKYMGDLEYKDFLNGVGAGGYRVVPYDVVLTGGHKNIGRLLSPTKIRLSPPAQL